LRVHIARSQRSTLVIEVLPEDIELARKSRESFEAKELDET
jgi:hypothetical protein